MSEVKALRAGGASLENIKDRCFIDGKHWIWTGAESKGTPQVWAPDLSRDGKMVVMTVARAVLQLCTCKPIPAGHRAYRTCDVELCVSPKCIKGGPMKQWGAMMSKSDRYSGAARSIARVKIARSMRTLSDAQIIEVQLSEDSVSDLSARFACSKHVIYRARTGSYHQISSPFSGLMGHAARS